MDRIMVHTMKRIDSIRIGLNAGPLKMLQTFRRLLPNVFRDLLMTAKCPPRALAITHYIP